MLRSVRFVAYLDIALGSRFLHVLAMSLPLSHFVVVCKFEGFLGHSALGASILPKSPGLSCWPLPWRGHHVAVGAALLRPGISGFEEELLSGALQVKEGCLSPGLRPVPRLAEALLALPGPAPLFLHPPTPSSPGEPD